MFKPSNALNDPARVSQMDYARQDGKKQVAYQYQRSDGQGATSAVPAGVKHVLSQLKPKK